MAEHLLTEHTDERHTACRGTAATLSADEALGRLDRLPDWRIVDDRLVRDLRFDGFAESVAFIDRLAAAAEQLNHHPEVELTDKRRVRVTLWTHKASALTELDFELAAATDALVDRPPGAVLTHTDGSGRARMVDVSPKEITHRVAVASAVVRMQPSTRDLITRGGVPKGDVLGTARLAGVMAAKRTAELVPLCHPLALDHVDLDIEPFDENGLRITSTAAVHGRTGVEMEALTAVMGAALTVYDMCKAVDRAMQITEVRLDHKRGGRTGEFTRPPDRACPTCRGPFTTDTSGR